MERTESTEVDVLKYYDIEPVEVSAYSPEELEWYGAEITPDIVKPRQVIVTQQVDNPPAKKRGRPAKKK